MDGDDRLGELIINKPYAVFLNFFLPVDPFGSYLIWMDSHEHSKFKKKTYFYN